MSMYRFSRLVFSYANLCPKLPRPSLQLQPLYQSKTGFGRVRLYCSNSSNANTSAGSGSGAGPSAKKQSVFQKLKSMFKDYWYVAIPVHVVTSTVWFGSFYQAAKSGLDVKGYMKYLGFSDNIIDKIGNSGAGNIAVAYALYKVATPARYAVTVGCSTYAINILKSRGYIRTAKEISQPARDMINKKKDQYLAKQAANQAKKPPSGKT